MRTMLIKLNIDSKPTNCVVLLEDFYLEDYLRDVSDARHYLNMEYYQGFWHVV